MKIEVTLAQFSALAAPFEAKQKGNLLYVSLPRVGKVELNTSSGRWVVGSGSKFPDAVLDAAVSAGFSVAKRAPKWHYLEFSSVEQLPALIKAVCSAAPSVAPKAAAPAPSKAPAAPKAPTGPKVDVEAIKSKNLATIKAVAAKLKAA